MTEKIKNESLTLEESKFKKLGKKILTFKNLNKLLFSVVIVFGMYYLTGINDLMVKGFRLQELKREQSKAASELRDLENQVMNLESYARLSERAKELNMVAVGKEIAYINSNSDVVARR